MTLVGPLAFHTVASSLLDAIVERLAVSVAGAPERACVVPGAELADDDCECGSLYVAVTRSYYSTDPPAEASGFTAGSAGGGGPCELPYVTAELAVRIVRCAPGPDQRGNSPSCDALDAAARTVEVDAYETRLAVVCQLQGMVDEEIEGFLVRDQPRVGPAGACMGSQLNLAVWLANVCAEC